MKVSHFKTQFRSHTPEERESVRRPRDPSSSFGPNPDHAAPPSSTCRWVLPCFLSFLSSSSSALLFHFRPLLLLHSQTQARTQLTFFNHIFLGGGGLCLSLVVVAGGWLEPCNCKWVMARRLYSRLFHFHLQQPSVSPRSHSDNYTRARAHIYMLS